VTATDPLGGVQIGAREIYDEVKAVGSKLDRLADAHDEVRTDVADHEQRIRSLEKARWPLPSIAALVAVASLIVALLSYMAKTGG
jgi:hypothetical protein